MHFIFPTGYNNLHAMRFNILAGNHNSHAMHFIFPTEDHNLHVMQFNFPAGNHNLHAMQFMISGTLKD